jgi:cytochrome c-type biogenesis protein
MNVKTTFLKITKIRHSLPKWAIWVGLAMLTTISILLTKQLNLLELLESAIARTENQYQQWGESQPLTNPWLLIAFAFGGGLLASISPCILAMLPVNLSYIGTLNVTSRRAAVWNATGFVLGVVTILSMFGLFASVAGAIMVEWRGYINLAVGVIIIWMGLSIGGVVHLPLPLPRSPISLPPFAGTYGVGLTFALVSSPCASPVLLAVLAAAGATGSPIWSVVTMVAYALGYTAVIFAASLCAGLIKLIRQILVNSEVIVRAGGLALVLMGGYYVVSGVLWFL